MDGARIVHWWPPSLAPHFGDRKCHQLSNTYCDPGLKCSSTRNQQSHMQKNYRHIILVMWGDKTTVLYVINPIPSTSNELYYRRIMAMYLCQKSLALGNMGLELILFVGIGLWDWQCECTSCSLGPTGSVGPSIACSSTSTYRDHNFRAVTAVTRY